MTPFATILTALLLAASAAAQSSPSAPSRDDPPRRPDSPMRAGAAAPVDWFHPDHQPRADGTLPPLPEPAWGGRAVIHIEQMPKALNGALDVSAVSQRILYETNELLLLQNWDTQELEPDVSASWDIEDVLVPQGGRGDGSKLVFGKVREDGDVYRVTSGSKANPLEGERVVPKSEVASLERGTVFTFHLRDGVRWHDGHPFDAHDVVFSWSLFQKPLVKCDDKRPRFVKVWKAEALDRLTVRFFYEKQYFNALYSIGDLPLVPRHLYDLLDPDNVTADPEYHARKKAADPAWTPSETEIAEYVNTNPRNRMWIGLGPYRVVEWTSDTIVARRWDGYFAPERGGYLDEIRWRNVGSTTAGYQALLAGELDQYAMLSTDEYFGEATARPAFTERYYKAWADTFAYWYVGWNMHRDLFADVRVRRAFAHAFDGVEFKRSFYKGLATRVTGPWPARSPANDPTVEPLPHDHDKAADLLAEAGWYQRNPEGVLEKDGVPFEFELLAQSGNPVATAFGARFQESLKRLGVRLSISTMDLSAVIERRAKREFDAVLLGWSPALEVDPEQLWHSRWGKAGTKGSNYVGLQDAVVDALIDAGQVELDRGKRMETWHALHRRLHELQPYLFCFNTPRKLAINKALRGYQTVLIDPNYVVRRWYYPKGTPGTRATPSLPK